MKEQPKVVPINLVGSVARQHLAEPDADQRRRGDLLHALVESGLEVMFVADPLAVGISLMKPDGSGGVPMLLSLRADGTWELKNE